MGGTRGSPIMPRDVSLSDSICWNGGHKWVNRNLTTIFKLYLTFVAIAEILSAVGRVASLFGRHRVSLHTF